MLGSVAFRLALVYALVFALGGGVLWATFDFAMGRYAADALTADLRTETQVLLAEDGGADQTALIRKVQARSRLAGPFVYSVTDAQGKRLAGQLPDGLMPRRGLDQIQLPHPEEDGGDVEEIPVKTLTTAVPDGVLVVGKSTYALHELEEFIHQLGAWAVAGLALIAGVAGAAAGGLLASRLNRINAAASRVMEGKRGERVPSVGLGVELETVRSNLNALLDWQEKGLDALRHVSTDIAHDLRTPLNRLRQRLDRAQAEAIEERVPASTVSAAIGDLDQVLETFSALLRIGQLEGGAGRSHFQPLKLERVIERVFEAYLPVSEETGHELIRIVDSDAEVMGDPELLVQLLTNLIDNALTHSGTGSRIQIEAYEDDRKVILAVRDTGHGVPEGELSRLTRRFHRLDSSRQTPGQGLGLSLVAAITALHEGELVIASNHPGLAVRIVLPMLRGEP